MILLTQITIFIHTTIMETTKQIDSVSKQMDRITLEIKELRQSINSLGPYKPRDRSAIEKAQLKSEHITSQLNTVKLYLTTPNSSTLSTYFSTSVKIIELEFVDVEVALKVIQKGDDDHRTADSQLVKATEEVRPFFPILQMSRCAC